MKPLVSGYTGLEDLWYRLLLDLETLKLPVEDVDVHFRPYSKTYYGRYFPVYEGKRDRPKIHLYPFDNKVGDLLPYDTLLTSGIHEFCHHLQYANGHERVKGVMHDVQFWKLYNHYVERAGQLGLVSAKVMYHV